MKYIVITYRYWQSDHAPDVYARGPYDSQEEARGAAIVEFKNMSTTDDDKEIDYEVRRFQNIRESFLQNGERFVQVCELSQDEFRRLV